MTDARNRTLFGADCRMSGELHLDNDAVIMGQFEGLLRVTGKLDLPRTANINGMVVAGECRVDGQVNADIVIEHQLEVGPGAVIIGDVYAPHVLLDKEGQVRGRVHIGPDALEAAARMLSRAVDEADGHRPTAPAHPAASRSTDAPAPRDARRTSATTSPPSNPANPSADRPRPQRTAPASNTPTAKAPAQREASESASADTPNTAHPPADRQPANSSAPDLDRPTKTPADPPSPMVSTIGQAIDTLLRNRKPASTPTSTPSPAPLHASVESGQRRDDAA